jgi:hypothetical protein
MLAELLWRNLTRESRVPMYTRMHVSPALQRECRFSGLGIVYAEEKIWSRQ